MGEMDLSEGVLAEENKHIENLLDETSGNIGNAEEGAK